MTSLFFLMTQITFQIYITGCSKHLIFFCTRHQTSHQLNSTPNNSLRSQIWEPNLLGLKVENCWEKYHGVHCLYHTLRSVRITHYHINVCFFDAKMTLKLSVLARLTCYKLLTIEAKKKMSKMFLLWLV